MNNIDWAAVKAARKQVERDILVRSEYTDAVLLLAKAYDEQRKELCALWDVIANLSPKNTPQSATLIAALEEHHE